MSIANLIEYNMLDTRIGDVVLPLFLANAAGAPVNGTSGTLAGVARPGSLLLTQEVALYQNTGTQASPTWSSTPTTAEVTAAISAQVTAAFVAALFPPSTFTLNGVTSVTVANTAITANSIIIFTLKTAHTPGAYPAIATITPGTGFTVAGTAADVSVYNYIVIG